MRLRRNFILISLSIIWSFLSVLNAWIIEEGGSSFEKLVRAIFFLPWFIYDLLPIPHKYDYFIFYIIFFFLISIPLVFILKLVFIKLIKFRVIPVFIFLLALFISVFFGSNYYDQYKKDKIFQKTKNSLVNITLPGELIASGTDDMGCIDSSNYWDGQYNHCYYLAYKLYKKQGDIIITISEIQRILIAQGFKHIDFSYMLENNINDFQRYKFLSLTTPVKSSPYLYYIFLLHKDFEFPNVLLGNDQIKLNEELPKSILKEYLNKLQLGEYIIGITRSEDYYFKDKAF